MAGVDTRWEQKDAADVAEVCALFAADGMTDADFAAYAHELLTKILLPHLAEPPQQAGEDDRTDAARWRYIRQVLHVGTEHPEGSDFGGGRAWSFLLLPDDPTTTERVSALGVGFDVDGLVDAARDAAPAPTAQAERFTAEEREAITAGRRALFKIAHDERDRRRMSPDELNPIAVLDRMLATPAAPAEDGVAVPEPSSGGSTAPDRWCVCCDKMRPAGTSEVVTPEGLREAGWEFDGIHWMCPVCVERDRPRATPAAEVRDA